MSVKGRLAVNNVQMGVAGRDGAAVTFLAARFAIERGPFRDHLDRIAGCSRFNWNAVPDNCQHRSVDRHFVIADKLAAHSAVVKLFIDLGNPLLTGAFPVFAGLLPLPLHADFKAGFVDGKAFALDDIGGQIGRESRRYHRA